MVENGIKPVYVFDGKPPDMKSGEVSHDYVRFQEKNEPDKWISYQNE